MGQPLGIFPISLVPLTSFDILSIGQTHDHAALQNIEDRLPVWTGAFHNYVRTVGSHQPLLHRFQISGESAELAHFTFGSASAGPTIRHTARARLPMSIPAQ